MRYGACRLRSITISAQNPLASSVKTTTTRPSISLAISLLREKQFGDAITVFKLNVAEYPQDANTYDSLAEAYMDAGVRESAIQNYEESLRLNPKNQNAVSQLETLRAK